MAHYFRFTITAFILMLASAPFAMAATLTVNASSDGVYTVQGSNMDNVAGIEMTLSYSTTSLASPAVTLGDLVTGSMIAANTTIPGSIRIGIIRLNPFSGSGPVVTITFATHTGDGSVSLSSFNLVNSVGATVASSSAVTDSSSGSGSSSTSVSGFSSASSTSTTNSSASSSNNSVTAGSVPVAPGATYLGSVTLPAESQAQNSAKQPPAPENAALPVEIPPPAEASGAREMPASDKNADLPKKDAAETVASTPVLAVVERFRSYQGVKNPASLIALFKQPVSSLFRQTPLVALSDGTTTVTIAATLPTATGASPSFALNNARLVSLQKDDTSSAWLIEALPAKGALSASLLVMGNDHILEYPLTIAPAIPAVAATEAEFAAYLKNAEKNRAQHDLNSDGSSDGTDDYIYTANYLARQQKKPR